MSKDELLEVEASQIHPVGAVRGQQTFGPKNHILDEIMENESLVPLVMSYKKCNVIDFRTMYTSFDNQLVQIFMCADFKAKLRVLIFFRNPRGQWTFWLCEMDLIKSIYNTLPLSLKKPSMDWNCYSV